MRIDKLEAATEVAKNLERRAEQSGDPQDWVAASTRYADAAHIAHMWGIDADAPKADRDDAYKIGVELNRRSTHCKDRSRDIISAQYSSQKEVWARRDVLTPTGAPPQRINVLDNHGGFSAETTPRNSLWRPGAVLEGYGSTIGTLISSSTDTKSFYQQNDNVTLAKYRVRGYRYPIMVWFDNATGYRIA